MTAAAKRIVKVLATLGTAVVMTACGTAGPAAPRTEEAPSAPQTQTGQVSPASVPTVGPAITTDLVDATIGRYGTRTKATFVVKASGSKLRYKWQHRPATGGSWKTISGAKSARYTTNASKWANGTRFRVVVTGTGGKVVSSTARLTVLLPTRTPARDAENRFGLSALSQGVDLSAYQYTPSARVKLKAIAAWAGADGFAILRNGSGARPIKQVYTSVCTNKRGKTGKKPITEDCAYRVLADGAQAAGLSLGHYWFNGWIASIDKTKGQLFAGGYTPEDSARQFVKWLKRDGNYTKASTDPLVLDVEAGSTWTKTVKGKKYKQKLRAWKPKEAMAFLTTVRKILIQDGYQANLYVYMSANETLRQSKGAYAWTDVAGVARLWVAGWGTNNGRIPDFLPNVGPWVYQGGWSIWQYTSNANIPGDGVGQIDGDIAKHDAWVPR